MKRKQTTISSFFGKRPCPTTHNSEDDLQNTPPDSNPQISPGTSSPRNNLKNKTLSPKKIPLISVENTPTDSEDSLFASLNIDSFLLNDWEETLTFNIPRHCLVVKTERKNFDQILHVKDKNSLIEGKCILREMWAANIVVSADNPVVIQAVLWNNDWVVDNQNGFVVLFPDVLISSTTLVGSMYCRRKGVLSTIFRGLGEDNKIMVIGQLVHEILQISIKDPNCDLNLVIDGILSDSNTLRTLFSCNTSVAEMKKSLSEYVPQITNFLSIYIKKNEPPMEHNFLGVINKVLDIEENLSSTNFGLKGRVDITAEVLINNKKKILPIEVKTGKASFSPEHKSQVLLYVMMMGDLGRVVESGLLLYLKEGIFKEIQPGRLEIRDLILLRNDLVTYLSERFLLPEPLRRIQGCIKCEYVNICKSYLEENHPLRQFGTNLSASHIEYVNTWTKLLCLEDTKTKSYRIDKMVPEQKIDNNKYLFNINETQEIKLGSFIKIISQKSQQSFLGNIFSLGLKTITVQIEQKIDFSGLFWGEIPRTSFFNSYLTNVGALLDEPYKNIRDIVVDLKEATFTKLNKSILTPECKEILKKLNTQQQRAILKTLSTNDFLLIKGPPGTGKTETIVNLIHLLVKLNQKIILCSHTNSAVDTILKRIKLDFLRLGSLKSIDCSLHDKCYENLKIGCKSLEDMKNLFKKPIIASTCLGLDSDLVCKEMFDICIIDEASQVLQPEALKPLFSAKKFVLIGDPHQLPPVVTNPEARKQGMGVSIFDRLYKENHTVVLKQQYRMNETLMGIANRFVYKSTLEVGIESLRNSTLNLKINENTPLWLKKILSTKIENSFVFVDTSDYLKVYPETSFSNSNPVEANILHCLVNSCLELCLDPKNVGIITPFRAQIATLQGIIPNTIEINTVDQFQGRDKDLILYSCSKQDRKNVSRDEFEILNDIRRLTVALTRAKKKLIVVGDRETLVFYQPFAKLFEILEETQFVFLKNCVDDFAWDSVI